MLYTDMATRAMAYAKLVKYPPFRDLRWSKEEDRVFRQIFEFSRYVRFQGANGELRDTPDEWLGGATGSPVERRLLLEVFVLRATVILRQHKPTTEEVAPLLLAVPIDGVSTQIDVVRVVDTLTRRCGQIASDVEKCKLKRARRVNAGE